VLLNHPVASSLLNKKYEGKRGWGKVKNYSKDIAEDYFNSSHFNFILTCEPIVRTSYKAQISQKAVWCTKGITYRYMRSELKLFLVSTTTGSKQA
jgi:hypothetical protein